MGIGEEVLDTRFLEVLVDAGVVAALGQPDAAGTAAEMLLVGLGGDHDLGADGLRGDAHQGQEAVGGGAGHDLEHAQVLELLEGRDQVALVLVDEGVTGLPEEIQVVAGEVVEMTIEAGPLDLLGRQLDQLVEVVDVAALEQGIREHRDQGRGHGHRDAEVDAVGDQAVIDVDERDVGLGDRLVEPILLEEVRVLRVANERQVGMQHHRQVAFGHDQSSSGAFGPLRGSERAGGMLAVKADRRETRGRPGEDPAARLAAGPNGYGCVSRLTVMVMERSMSPSAFTAWMGIGWRPSGKAKRIEKVPSGRSSMFWPRRVTFASGSVAP